MKYKGGADREPGWYVTLLYHHPDAEPEYYSSAGPFPLEALAMDAFKDEPLFVPGESEDVHVYLEKLPGGIQRQLWPTYEHTP